MYMNIFESIFIRPPLFFKKIQSTKALFSKKKGEKKKLCTLKAKNTCCQHQQVADMARLYFI